MGDIDAGIDVFINSLDGLSKEGGDMCTRDESCVTVDG